MPNKTFVGVTNYRIFWYLVVLLQDVHVYSILKYCGIILANTAQPYIHLYKHMYIQVYMHTNILLIVSIPPLASMLGT